MTVIERRDISVDEEKDLVESTERGEWVPIGLTVERRDFWKSAARSVIDGKRRRISIAVPGDGSGNARPDTDQPDHPHVPAGRFIGKTRGQFTYFGPAPRPIALGAMPEIR